MIYYWDSEPRLQHQAITDNKHCSFIVDLIKGAIKKRCHKKGKNPHTYIINHMSAIYAGLQKCYNLPNT